MRKLKFFLLMAAGCFVLIAAIATIVSAASYKVRYNFSVVDEDGVPIGSNKVLVQVYSAGTTTAATLYDSSQNDSQITPPFTTDDGDISFWGGDVLYDFLIYDSPVMTTQIKRTSVAPTTHRIMFPQLSTYAPSKILGELQELTDEDTCPVVAGSFYKTGTTTATINNFQYAHDSETGLTAGQILVVQSKGAITFDVTSSGLIGGTTDVVTAAGDITTWIYDGTSWSLMSFMDLSDNLN